MANRESWPVPGSHEDDSDSAAGPAEEATETDGLIGADGHPEEEDCRSSEDPDSAGHLTCGSIFRSATDATFAGIVTLYAYTLRPVVTLFTGAKNDETARERVAAASPVSIDSVAGAPDFHPGQGYEPIVSPKRTYSTTQQLVPGSPEFLGNATGGPPSPSEGTVAFGEQSPETLVQHERITQLAVLQQRLAVLSAVCPLRAEAESGGDSGGRVIVNLSVALNTLPVETPLDVREDSLRELEEVLLEDLDDAALVLCSLHVLDISFVSPSDSTPILGWANSRHSASSLDLQQQQPLTTSDHVALHHRIITLVNSLIEAVSKASSGVRLTFTRCDMTPTALVETLFLPASGLRYLSFSRCPFTDAHVHALLRRARRTDSLFASLRFLQLSGASLSRDAVTLLLRYMDEEVDSPVLGELVVPQSLADCANSHPLSIRLPALMVNGRRIAAK
jgi:hypothetical protein